MADGLIESSTWDLERSGRRTKVAELANGGVRRGNLLVDRDRRGVEADFDRSLSRRTGCLRSREEDASRRGFDSQS